LQRKKNSNNNKIINENITSKTLTKQFFFSQNNFNIIFYYNFSKQPNTSLENTKQKKSPNIPATVFDGMIEPKTVHSNIHFLFS
jgi:hypothetical protein